ncbi:hypothetical protein Tco_0876956 [Tanacetum coccineum]|uniref:MAK10-like protein n=1 Tax=Tanacetum coccineum TaxID=301880 RepID=A0ABQ5BTR4_9ASTR
MKEEASKAAIAESKKFNDDISEEHGWLQTLSAETKVIEEIKKVLEEPDSTKVEVKQEGHEDSTRKRPGRRLKMKATKKSKRQKTDSDLEEEEQLKAFLMIVPDEEGIIDYEVLEKRFPIINWESKFYEFDRHELSALLQKSFRSDRKDELWQNQERWNLKSWDLYENYGVHTLILEDGTKIHMLAKRKYPLTKETLERMISLRLVARTASEDTYTLLRFIQKQIDEYGNIKNWLVQKQTAFGKDFSNPFTADSLLKTICAPCYSNEALAIPEQTATGKEISNPFMAGEDCWVLEDFTTYYCWFYIGAASEDLVLINEDFVKRLRSTLEEEGDHYIEPTEFEIQEMEVGFERTSNISISSWGEILHPFLAQFFPPKRTAKLCNDILMFQHIKESLFLKHGLISRTYSKKSFIMASTFGSKYKSFMIVSILSQDEPSINRPVAISLPQDVSRTSDRRLIELENQVQRLMEAHLDPKQSVVNKITSSCKICSDPHDTQYCMENPEQAFVDYVSSRTKEVGGNSINAITICPTQPNKSRDDKSEEEGREEKDNPKNINTTPPSPPHPTIPFITEKARRLNSSLESSGLVPRSSDIKFVYTKKEDRDVMFIEIIKKYDDSHKEELEEDENAMTRGLGVEYFDILPTRSELAHHQYLMSGPIPSLFLRDPIIVGGCPSNLKIPGNIGHVHV